jgi:hypothetical protein
VLASLESATKEIASVPVNWVEAAEFIVKLTLAFWVGEEVGEALRLRLGTVIVNGSDVDVVPAIATVMLAVPGAAINFAGTAAINWVLLTKVVVNPVLFHCTTAPEIKPVPLTVSVKAGPPAVAESGLSEAITGPALIVKVAPPEVTPLSTTVTVAVPGAAMRLAGTWAVNCVALTKVVVSAVVFHRTTALETNPDPFTVSVKEGPPAAAELGLSEVITGPKAMVKATLPDVTPFSTTVTYAVPGAAMRLAATCAVSCVALTKVVGNEVLFHRTTALEIKPEPFTVSVKAPLPAIAAFGLSEEITGAGPIVNVALVDVTPPSTTVTVTVPGLAMKLAATCAVN